MEGAISCIERENLWGKLVILVCMNKTDLTRVWKKHISKTESLCAAALPPRQTHMYELL